VTDFDAYAWRVQLYARSMVVPHMVTVAMNDDRVVVIDAFLHAGAAVAHLLAHAVGACRLRESQRTG
jgi:hypothetical protein